MRVAGNTKIKMNQCRSFLLALLLICGASYGGPTASTPFFEANKAYEKGNFTQATQLYQAAIKAKDQEVFAWFNMGNALIQLKKNHLALVAYKRATELAPQFGRPWAMIGDLNYLNEFDGEAIGAYKRALDLGEEPTRIWSALAEIALRNKEWTEAQRWFEKLIQNDVLNTNAWLALVQIQENLGDDEGAKDILKKCLNENPLASGNVHFYLARLNLKMGLQKEAIKALENGLFFDPSQTQYRRSLARIYSEDNQPWMAIFTLEDGLAKKPNDAKMNLDLAQLYFEQMRYEESTKYFSIAYNLGLTEAKIGLENIKNKGYNDAH